MERIAMQDTLSIARALADSGRLRVLSVLLARNELCVCQITALLELATATVSRHMSVLHAAGLVRSRKQGRWVYYGLAEAFPPSLRAWLEESFSASPQAAADRAAVERILDCDRDELCRTRRRTST
jgi:ArsR family transcriptional regulator, arsenate/arsenite/antimonite-responsive transcriptional repressor